MRQSYNSGCLYKFKYSKYHVEHPDFIGEVSIASSDNKSHSYQISIIRRSR